MLNCGLEPNTDERISELNGRAVFIRVRGVKLSRSHIHVGWVSCFTHPFEIPPPGVEYVVTQIAHVIIIGVITVLIVMRKVFIGCARPSIVDKRSRLQVMGRETIVWCGNYLWEID